MNSTEINTLNRSTTINTPNNSATVSTSNRSTTVTEDHPAISTALAVIGFVALVAAGIWLAVYSTRYVPSVVNGVGEAAVYLGSIFTPAPASLAVIPTASSTVSAATSTTSIGVGSTVPTKPAESTSGTTGYPTSSGPRTSGSYVIGGSGPGTTLYGNPDLIVTIKGVGYLATSSADSFVASSTVPSGSRPAVSFTIKNIGTNATGMWRFSASIPAQVAYIYQSQPQQSLNPGDSIDYTLGFDQANRGSGQMISITANYDKAVTESNSSNNSASATITILGN